MAKQEQLVTVHGRRIRVSNLQKVLYPRNGTTKGDVIAYYSAVAATMLPHCEGRPATRKRWPDGVGEDGARAFFFQKDLGDAAPDWVETGQIQHKDHVNTYPLVNDEATLVWLAQRAALEIHVPQWRFGASGTPANPDRMVFDLDPGDGVDLPQCARVAFLVRDLLRGMGLESIPVTSGSSGIHLYAALDGKQTSDEVSAVAKELARALEADHPDDITSSMRRDLRPGKVFIDWSQNNAAKTTVAPYSLRGRATPTVAAPRSWRELASPHLKQLEFTEVLARLDKRGDPLAALLDSPRTSSKGARDRLVTYRAKRDATRTPEPVPEAGEASRPASAGDDAEGERRSPIFVIQRHEARRLHHDFRLEHDGVLVSWALPKGVPDDPSRNHLAVMTEDHPLSYASFEGVIPAGEYGAGSVRIWDSGTYTLEKWRDDEVIATLHGAPGGGLGGSRRFALFRAGGSASKPQWMIHLMKPPPRTETYAPMLAETASDAALASLDAEEWAFEMKWDGIRVIAEVDGDRCVLRSRSGADLSATYPELASLPRALHVDRAVLDGELVAIGANGAPSFSRLQQRFGLTRRADVARAKEVVPAMYLVFDVLSIDGTDCRALSYEQRRELLIELFDAQPGGPAAVPDAFDGTGEQAMQTSRELGLEGLVAKRRRSSYSSGVRSSNWLKFPFIDTAEVVVIGWRESSADPSGLASLLLAELEPVPRYAGRVGTGFSAAERRALLEKLRPLEQPSPACDVPSEARREAHWVRPALAAEVVSKGRTASGALRQPVWRGWRPDKNPSSQGGERR